MNLRWWSSCSCGLSGAKSPVAHLWNACEGYLRGDVLVKDVHGVHPSYRVLPLTGKLYLMRSEAYHCP